MEKNTPLVSVLIPAYNHEKYVQKSIKSIISQTYRHIELIVLDDGSTDSTWTRIQELKLDCKQRFERTIFETQENRGTCLTLNRLIDLCSPESSYVYIIASDDIADHTAIEKQVDFMEINNKYGLCVGDNAIIDSNGTICYWDNCRNNVYEKEKATYITFGDFLQKASGVSFCTRKFGQYKYLYRRNHVPNGYLIRKCVFDNFRFTKEAPLEDYNLMLHISKYYKMKFLSEILFYYRWHRNNTIKNTEKIMNMTKITHDYEDSLLKKINLLKIIPGAGLFIFFIREEKNKNFFILFALRIYRKIDQIKKIMFSIISKLQKKISAPKYDLRRNCK